jgi:hypothetical protein
MSIAYNDGIPVGSEPSTSIAPCSLWKHLGQIFILLALAILPAFVVIRATEPFGPGVSPDSTAYLGAAKSLRDGYGYTLQGEPLSHFPPLYSVLLAGVGHFTGDLEDAARYCGAILFSVNAVLLFLLLRLGGLHFLSSGLIAAFFACHPSIVEIHTMAWSEPLFFSLLLGSLLFHQRFFATGNCTWLIPGAMLFGLAMVTRYSGLLIWPALAAFCIWKRDERGAIWGRLRPPILWAAISITPYALWTLRNMLMAGSRGLSDERRLEYAFLNGGDLFDLTATVSSYTTGTYISYGIRIIGLIILTAAILTLVGKDWRKLTRLSWLCLAISMFYPAAVAFAKIRGHAIPLDYRILSPLFLCGLIFVGNLVVLNGPALLLAFAIVFPVNVDRSGQFLQQVSAQGLGFNRATYRDAPWAEYARTHTTPVLISNNGGLLTHITGRAALALPPRKQWAERKDKLLQSVENGTATVVFFTDFGDVVLPGAEELEALFPPSYARQLGEAVFYAAPARNSSLPPVPRNEHSGGKKLQEPAFH